MTRRKRPETEETFNETLPADDVTVPASLIGDAPEIWGPVPATIEISAEADAQPASEAPVSSEGSEPPPASKAPPPSKAPPALEAPTPLEAPASFETPPRPMARPASKARPRPCRARSRKFAVLASAALVAVVVLGLAAYGYATSTAQQPVSTNRPYIGSTQGCDWAYWASTNHFSAWQEYQPDQIVGSLFSHASTYADLTLADALGNQVNGEDVRRTLIREGVTAALNAAHDSLAYPFARYADGADGRPPLVPTINRLLTSGTDAEIVQFTADLSTADHLGCPL